MTAVVRAVLFGRRLVPQAASTYQINKRYVGEDSTVAHGKGSTVAHGKGSTLANYKRGSGGRSSFSGIVATVFGCSGSFGHYVVNKLAKIGSQVILPYRSEPYHLKELRLCGDLGQILFVPFDLQDEDSIRKAMQYSNTVINLVGRTYETKNYTFKDVHVDGARRIARIAKECGVSKLIHFSALNASPNPQKVFLYHGSQFLQSKYEGELAVREEFPEAVIFRPADIFSMHDNIMSYFLGRSRRIENVNPFIHTHHLPLWKTGTHTTKMPVFQEDVTDALIQAIDLPWANGETFELYGPVRMYLYDMVNYMLYISNHENVLRVEELNFMNRLRLSLRSKVRNYFFAAGYSDEGLEQECITDVATGCPTLKDLGVTNLTRMEQVYPSYARKGWMLKPEVGPNPASYWRDLPPWIKEAR